MSPRKSVLETAATRSRIIDRALALATSEGLEAVTIGRLADDLEMSKAGVIGHFGTKEAMQLAVVAEAVARFEARVPARVVGARPGAERLARAYGEWVDSMAPREGHAGCFLTSVAAEFDGRPGAVRDAVAEAFARWAAYVRGELRAAVEAGDLAPDADLEQIAFELSGVVLAAGQAVQLRGDSEASARARRAFARILQL